MKLLMINEQGIYVIYESKHITIFRQPNTYWTSIEWGQFIYNNELNGWMRKHNFTFSPQRIKNSIRDSIWRFFNKALQPKGQKGQQLHIDENLLVIGFSVLLVGVML